MGIFFIFFKCVNFARRTLGLLKISTLFVQGASMDSNLYVTTPKQLPRKVMVELPRSLMKCFATTRPSKAKHFVFWPLGTSSGISK